MRPVHVFIAVALVSLVPWFLGDRYFFHIATMATIMIPMAASMNLMLKIGQLSLAHVAFMGIGAYGSALLTMRFGVPPALSLVMGGLLVAAVAGAFGPVFLRIKGTYFVLLTFAFGEIVNLIMQDWISLTNGNSGLFGIPRFSIFGFRLTAVQHYYALGMIWSLIAFGVLWAIEKSDIAAIFQSLNENEMVTRSLGGNAMAWRIAAFVLSAFIAGVSGGIYAFYIGLLTPDAFGMRAIVDLLVMNTIGGASSVIGPLLGAILIVPLPELLREAREYQLLIYGLCLATFLMFFRQGLVALVRFDKGRSGRRG
jgi:branched-chain amino acid transport system permease protein